VKGEFSTVGHSNRGDRSTSICNDVFIVEWVEFCISSRTQVILLTINSLAVWYWWTKRTDASRVAAS